MPLAGGGLTGVMKQNGRTFPVTAARVAAGSGDGATKRPQAPKPPFPYTAREVKVENLEAKVTLAGTLTVPKTPGPHPAAVLLTGSGPQDRDETLFGHKPFLVLADHLSRNGVAVLRLDDRGFGQSTGDLATATTADFASDARAALLFMAVQPEVDVGGLGLIGHSEGGLVAAMVAGAEGPKAGVAWVVLLASPGLSGRELVLYQTSEMYAPPGTDPAKVRAARDAAANVLDLLAADAWRWRLKRAVRALTKAQMAMGGPIRPDQLDSAVQAGVTRMQSPWYRFFVTYDPRPDLRRISVPVLALNGALDTQVPADAHLRGIEQALTAGGNQDVTTVKLKGLNHLFQTADRKSVV